MTLLIALILIAGFGLEPADDWCGIAIIVWTGHLFYHAKS